MVTKIQTDHSHVVRAGENRRVVYMCMFGYSEAFSDFQYEDAETDFVCFTDDPDLQSNHWTVVHLNDILTDPVRAAKRIKHMPSERLLGYETSLYVDNTLKLKAEINDIFLLLERSPASLHLFQHPWRSCIYEEGELLISERLDDPKVLKRQLDFYRRLGHPPQAGLFASGMMLRRHHDDFLNRTMLEWHLQVARHSYRDQISLPFVLRRMGLPVAFFPGRLDDNELMSWPAVRDDFRIPRDFDDQTYLELHPDVDSAGVNPRKHYFQFGHREGRSYRRDEIK